MGKSTEKAKMNWTVKGIIIVQMAIIVILVGFIIYINIKTQGQLSEMNGISADNLFAVILSIGCSIVASVLFAWITAAQDKQRDHELAEKIAETVETIYSQKQELTPKYFFCDTDMPQEQFNEMLDNKIRVCGNYRFLGDSARYTCQRLYEMAQNGEVNAELKIQIVLPNFACDDIYQNKKAFFERRERKINFRNQRPVDEIIREEKMKTIICLYAILQLKAYYDIHVYLVDEIPFMRIEVADDFLVLGFTQMQVTGKHYPPVMIYKDERVFYQSFNAYITENIERAKEIKPEEMQIEELVKAAKDASIENVDEALIRRFYESGCKS